MMQETVVTPDLKVAPNFPKRPEALNPGIVLEELFTLLEDYAPAWYQQKHRDRAVAALLGREV